MDQPTREHEYDGTGTGHQAYGEAAYRGRGQAGDEVADALESEFAAGVGADDVAGEHLSARMLRAEARGDVVPRLTEEDGGAGEAPDELFAEASIEGIDGDRHELTAEEAAMHFIDEQDDTILE